MAGARVDASETELKQMLAGGSFDLINTDAQHDAFDEMALAAFCATASKFNVPVRLRIRHTRETHLIGHYLDLGVVAIIVPQVEEQSTVDDAIDQFYYPPVGKRSWGPHAAWGFTPDRDRVEYATWWNNTGILSIQIESLDAVVNARKLAKPGVDMLLFGANDLSFSLETYKDAPFKTVADCVGHVDEQMAGSGIRVGEFGLAPEHMAALIPTK